MKVTREQLVTAISAYIRDEIVASDNGFHLAPEDDLLEDSIVDSLGIMRLVAFIESTYGFAVPAEDVTIEHFISVNAIADYLEPQL